MQCFPHDPRFPQDTRLPYDPRDSRDSRVPSVVMRDPTPPTDPLTDDADAEAETQTEVSMRSRSDSHSSGPSLHDLIRDLTTTISEGLKVLGEKVDAVRSEVTESGNKTQEKLDSVLSKLVGKPSMHPRVHAFKRPVPRVDNLQVVCLIVLLNALISS
ncbi:hypothetical protein LXA43DRAFT_1063142 [Ganoderma leucocontextum]|nr:hypothetical protein LXA43DRAFT_1063142 [Ganoderma leucocontextum]